MLNGVAVPATDCTVIAGTSYSACQIAIQAGAGTISDNDPFLLLVNGGTQYASYLTFAGTRFSTGASTPVKPTPSVPEPATFALLAAGLGALGLKRRKNVAQFG